MRLKSGIVLSMFLTSGNVYFVFAYVYLMCICLKTAIWLFVGQGLAILGEDRLATLVSFRGGGGYHTTYRKVMLVEATLFDYI